MAIAPKKYLVSIPCYNSEEWIGKCLDSLLSQTFSNWQAKVIIDLATDASEEIARKYAEKDSRISVITNQEKEYGLGSFVRGIKESDLQDEDIIVHLDGDDWLTYPGVLEFVDNIYQTEDIWMSYGSCKRTHGTPNASIENKCAQPMPENYDFRTGPWIFSVLKTFKYFLWKNIKDDDLRTLSTGKYYPRAWDTAMMRPMAEMAGREHIRYVPEQLYTYNDFHPNTCTEMVQMIYAEEIHNRKRYERKTKRELIDGSKEESGRLIILARYWNDMDFLQESLNQIDYWDADLVYLSEGAWDQKFKPRSTDGTREVLEKYAKGRDNVYVIDNIRKNENYRINQAETSNLVMRSANCHLGDWMMIVDVDQFYLKKDIDEIKRMMKEEGDTFDYFRCEVCNFLYDLTRYNKTFDTNQGRLPIKMVEGSRWIQTNHLSVNGKVYDNTNLKKRILTNIKALHYEGIRPKSRLTLRYSVGDRMSFWEFQEGKRLKNLISYNGNHSEFVADVLKGCCVFSEETMEYVKLQNNMDVSLYHRPPEVESVRKYFDSSTPGNVLDLGCGLGRCSVGFYKAFSTWTNTHFYLLDGNSGKKQIANINYTSEKSFYNDIYLTEKFCSLNGIPEDQIHILNAQDPEVFSSILELKFDFIYSFLAIGFHWPINLYLEKLLPYIHTGSILCFGIRPSSSGLFRRFNTYQINGIPEEIFNVLEVTKKDSYDSILVLEKK